MVHTYILVLTFLLLGSILWKSARSCSRDTSANTFFSSSARRISSIGYADSLSLECLRRSLSRFSPVGSGCRRRLTREVRLPPYSLPRKDMTVRRETGSLSWETPRCTSLSVSRFEKCRQQIFTSFAVRLPYWASSPNMLYFVSVS